MSARVTLVNSVRRRNFSIAASSHCRSSNSKCKYYVLHSDFSPHGPLNNGLYSTYLVETAHRRHHDLPPSYSPR